MAIIKQINNNNNNITNHTEMINTNDSPRGWRPGRGLYHIRLYHWTILHHMILWYLMCYCMMIWYASLVLSSGLKAWPRRSLLLLVIVVCWCLLRFKLVCDYVMVFHVVCGWYIYIYIHIYIYIYTYIHTYIYIYICIYIYTYT